jgi:hypothetical protein
MKQKNAYKVLDGNMKKRDHWEEAGVDGRLLRRIWNTSGECGLDLSGSEQGQVSGSSVQGNETSNS